MKIVKFNKKKIILILLIKKILKALNKAVYLNNLTFKIPIFTTKIDFNHLFLNDVMIFSLENKGV